MLNNLETQTHKLVVVKLTAAQLLEALAGTDNDTDVREKSDLVLIIKGTGDQQIIEFGNLADAEMEIVISAQEHLEPMRKLDQVLLARIDTITKEDHPEPKPTEKKAPVRKASPKSKATAEKTLSEKDRPTEVDKFIDEEVNLHPRVKGRVKNSLYKSGITTFDELKKNAKDLVKFRGITEDTARTIAIAYQKRNGFMPIADFVSTLEVGTPVKERMTRVLEDQGIRSTTDLQVFTRDKLSHTCQFGQGEMMVIDAGMTKHNISFQPGLSAN